MKIIRLISATTALDERINTDTICAYWRKKVRDNGKYGTRVLFTNGQERDYFDEPESVDKLLGFRLLGFKER